MRLYIYNISNTKVSGANIRIRNILSNKKGIISTINYKKRFFLIAYLVAHEGQSYYKV